MGISDDFKSIDTEWAKKTSQCKTCAFISTLADSEKAIVEREMRILRGEEGYHTAIQIATVLKRAGYAKATREGIDRCRKAHYAVNSH